MRMRDKYPEIYAANAVRIKSAMRAKAENGELPGCAPVGYKNHRLDSSTTEVVADDVMAPLVIEAMNLADSTDYTVRQLLEIMTTKGLRSRNGKVLGVSSFWKILTNPFYCGLIRYKGQLICGHHPPLISREQFEKVQMRLANRRRS